MPTLVQFHIHTARVWSNVHYGLTHTSTEDIKDLEELFWTETLMSLHTYLKGLLGAITLTRPRGASSDMSE